ncbi:MAG TPA: hypothetical protein VIJ41_03685, partial [Candidatus Nanopelagicales bacterium]
MTRGTSQRWLRWVAVVAAGVVVAGGLSLPSAAVAAAADPCVAPVVNQVACENSKPGNPASEWDIGGSGDPSIQGYAT